jgi:ABC-type dipeptide/oligopeptide/nickel transport system permease subunit
MSMQAEAGWQTEAGDVTVKPRGSLWGGAWHRLWRNRPAMVGLIIISLMYLTAIFAPLIAPFPYDKIDLNNVRSTPSREHLLGTDEVGHDVFSRVIWAARSAAFVSVTVTSLGLGLGIFFGVLAGYMGGWVDTLIMRLCDVLFAFPGLLFVFFIAATIQVVIIALSLVGWPGLARLIRGQLLSLREREYILAAQAVGVPAWKIMIRHLLPNAMPPVIVSVSAGVGGIILSETTLSFLGIGLQPPNPSWGAMISEYRGYWRTELWPLLFVPAAILVILILAFNFLGDGLNEVLNPQLDFED